MSQDECCYLYSNLPNRDGIKTWIFLSQLHHTAQGLIETLASMVIFDENQAVSDINKYEFLNTIYVQIVNFLVI